MGGSNTKIIDEFYALHAANPPPALTDKSLLMIPYINEYEDLAVLRPEVFGGRAGMSVSRSSSGSSRSSHYRSGTNRTSATISRLKKIDTAAWAISSNELQKVGSSTNYPKDGYLIAEDDVYHILDNVLEPMIKKYPNAKQALKLEFLKLIGLYPTNIEKINEQLKNGDIRVSVALAGFEMQPKPSNYEIVNLPNHIRLIKRNNAELIKTDIVVSIVENGNVKSDSDEKNGGCDSVNMYYMIIFAIILVGILLLYFILNNVFKQPQTSILV